jgi:hypothetical protein
MHKNYKTRGHCYAIEGFIYNKMSMVSPTNYKKNTIGVLGERTSTKELLISI